MIVSNSSPLIAFADIGQLHLLPAIFASIVIPPAVADEIAPSIPESPKWLRAQELTQPLPDAVLQRSLGAGEREALALAAEAQAERILLDDLSARAVARRLNIPTIGTAGVLLIAKRRGLIPDIRTYLDALLNASFFIGQDLYDELLREAGEGG